MGAVSLGLRTLCLPAFHLLRAPPAAPMGWRPHELPPLSVMFPPPRLPSPLPHVSQPLATFPGLLGSVPHGLPPVLLSGHCCLDVCILLEPEAQQVSWGVTS